MSRSLRGPLGFAPVSSPAMPQETADYPPEPGAAPAARVVARRSITDAATLLGDRELSFDDDFHTIDSEFATLLDNLVGMAAQQIVSAVVVAPVSVGETSMRVVQGLAAEARGRGLRTLECRMATTKGRRILLPAATSQSKPEQAGRGGAHDTGLDPLLLDLRGESGRTQLDSWLELATECFDLVIIDGAPLETGIDAALVARACDGLLLVAEEKRTTKEALRLAADRVRAAGCHTFGVAVDNSREQLPSWVRAVSTVLGSFRTTP